MISKPRVSDSLDILYELKDFLEYNDEIKDCIIQDDVLNDTKLDEFIISNCKIKNVSFVGSSLPRADFSDVVFENCDFITTAKQGSNSQDIFERGVCLPSDTKMTEEEQEKVIKIIKNLFI